MEQQKLTAFINDSSELAINLEWAGVSFEPADEWSLIFTAKDSDADLDSAAVFQKASGAGITVSGSVATVELVPADTESLTDGRRLFDVQAQNILTQKVRTVAFGEVYVMRDITRLTETSVPVTTTETPLPFARVAVEIHAAEEKTTLADSDEFGIVDSEEEPLPLKRLTWGNIRAALLLAFDLVYMKLTGLDGVMVTKKTGTRRVYVASADTDAARGLAFEAAMAAAIAGDTIDLPPGDFYVAKSTTTHIGVATQFIILAGMTIRLNGARLYHTATENGYCMFGADAVDGWSFIGPGIIEGTAATSSGASEIGINTRTSRRWLIRDLTVRYFRGTAIQANSSSYATGDYGSGKVSTGRIVTCNIDLNNIGIGLYAGSEYIVVIGSTINKNLTGADIYAGNTKFSGCEACYNTNYALRIRNGGNHGHGIWEGGMINHNLGFAVAVEASMNLGFTFTGSHFFADSNTTNKIQSLGGGITLTGCIVDSPFYASATPTGLNAMIGCFISGTFTVVTDLSAPEKAQWRFKENYTLTSAWSENN